MKDEKKLIPAKELLIIELDERYEFSGTPIVNDNCSNSNDCSTTINSICTNAGNCFA